MPRSSGTYTLPAGNPVVPATTITTTWGNNTLNDIANELTNSIPRDGTAPPTASMPMGGYAHTDVLETSGSTSRTEYASSGAVQDGTITDAGDTAGTSTAYTAILDPAITAYVSKQMFTVKFDQACGSTPTINFNSVGAKKLYYQASGTISQPAAAFLPSGFVALLRYDSALDGGAGGFMILNPPETILVSGTYTPTLVNSTNVAASTAYSCQYLRVGSVVHVSGRVDIDPTATGDTVLTMTLPIASNLGNSNELCGTAAGSNTTVVECFSISGDGTDVAAFQGAAVNTANHGFFFTFTYRVI